jgi:ACS family sodium-dependent inorganic phosphate cotransporter
LLGIAFPAIHTLISRWIPPQEQSTAVAFVTACCSFGSVLASLIAAPIGASYLGWPWIFYIFSFFSLLFLVPWHVYGYSSPEECPYLSPIEMLRINQLRKWSHQRTKLRTHSPPAEQEEEVAIAQSVSQDNLLQRKNAHQSEASSSSSPELELGIAATTESDSCDSPVMESEQKVPWGKILSRKEVWAILINHFCNAWGGYVLLTWLPSYYTEVYDVDLTEVGYFTGMSRSQYLLDSHLILA